MNKFTFLLPVSFLLCISISFAQKNKVDKYCQVVVAPKNGLAAKRIARISFGEDKALFAFKDTAITRQLKLVDHFTTETDVLNYMSKIGWTLVNVHSGFLYTSAEIFYFKKAFEISELKE